MNAKYVIQKTPTAFGPTEQVRGWANIGEPTSDRKELARIAAQAWADCHPQSNAHSGHVRIVEIDSDGDEIPASGCRLAGGSLVWTDELEAAERRFTAEASDY